MIKSIYSSLSSILLGLTWAGGTGVIRKPDEAALGLSYDPILGTKTAKPKSTKRKVKRVKKKR